MSRKTVELATRLMVASAAASILCLAAVEMAAGHHGPRSIMPTQNYGSGGCQKGGVCRTDNATLTIHKRDSLYPSGKAAVDDALNQWYEPTNLDVVRQAQPEYEGSTETDIIYGVSPADVPSGYIGWTACDDPSGYAICDQAYVYFEYIPGVDLACHETGHGVGLLHGSDAYPAQSDSATEFRCMRTPQIYGTYLGDHNRHQINISY